MMRRTTVLAGAFAVIGAAGLLGGMGARRVETPAGAAARAAGTWEVDPVRSSVVFRIKDMNTAYFYGLFTEMTGVIAFDDAKPEASSMDLRVSIDSVDTHSTNRDNHLKSKSFFDAKTYPEATFKSTSWKKTGDNMFDVTGGLSIHGVTKTVTVKLEKTGESARGARGVPIVGFATEFTINRDDFGITYLPDGLSKDVKLLIAINAGQR